jgi:cytosine/adenosine deaminase-related metal-dependent hydrolase
MNPKPIDPLEGPKYALRGRVVTMNGSRRVLEDGVLYIENGSLVSVIGNGQGRPAGFEKIKPVDVEGTIFPGLIELHNHLSYNALPMWKVPKKYQNRNQWAGVPEYRQLISGPMQVLGRTPGLLPAVVRYAECKCLLGGVTTSQGIELFSNAGARRYYRGIVRNVEQTDQADLPEAAAKIADVDAHEIERFYQRLLKESCFLLHLSEGVDDVARAHFLALRKPDRTWAITNALTGIHSTGLRPDDFRILRNHGGSMVWSPLSNLLLYGKTSDVAAAKRAGVRIGIGSDWSPSGSKNLLGELKVAWLVSQTLKSHFSAREIVEMATIQAAAILKWEKVLGSLEPNKRADVLVIEGTRRDPYDTLLQATEKDIPLVMINGIPRFGTPRLLGELGVQGESIKVGGLDRKVYLEQKTSDPAVGKIGLKEAQTKLKEALQKLPELAGRLERLPREAAPLGLTGRREEVSWFLALDEIEETGVELRPRLPFLGHEHTGPDRVPVTMRALMKASAEPLSKILQGTRLDPLTIADDEQYVDTLVRQKNLPSDIVKGIKGFYK